MCDARTFFALSGYALFGLTILFFSFLYFGAGFAAVFITKRLLPGLGLGGPIDRRRMRLHQEAEEVRWSLGSIAIFGLWTLIARWGLELGFLSVRWEIHWPLLPFEMAALLLINEVHFYFCHRLLHTSWLYRYVHIIHHRSVIPTPFSTYSFHPAEAFLLGSILIVSMRLYPFSSLALLSLPVMSILSNVIGHMNYDLVPNRLSSNFFAFSKRHSLHHTNVKGNFGFLFPFLDRSLGTSIIETQTALHGR